MTEAQQKFLIDAATRINAEREKYGIAIASPIIAQMVLESGWGTSTLATAACNYFGLTAGASWKGKTLRKYRAYDSERDGIRGYFEFIDTPRYANLKGVTDAEEYIDNIIADGYCDDPYYKNDLMEIIRTYDLTRFDHNTDRVQNIDIEKLVDDICAGVYGNGEERKEKLRALGLTEGNISAIQAKVTERFKDDKSDVREHVEALTEQFIQSLMELVGNG